MGISIEEMKKLESKGKVKDERVSRDRKGPIIALLKKERQFMSPIEIRDSIDAGPHIHAYLSWLKRNNHLIKKVINGKPYYGLPEFLES